jgi:hypothetical protein
MRIRVGQRWRLWQVARALGAADPHLAAMFAIFARLAAGEALPAREQTQRLPRVVHVFAVAAVTAAGLAGNLTLLVGQGLLRGGQHCRAALRFARRRLIRTERRGYAATSPAADGMSQQQGAAPPKQPGNGPAAA